MNARIGLGIITCNRESLFSQCIASTPSVERIIVVNDGKPYSNEKYPNKITRLVQHKRNRGVGFSKNEAIRYLLSEGCEHIFLSEDDVAVRNKNVCTFYIRAAEVSGILHFNYGLHGPANKTAEGKPHPRRVVQFPTGVRIAFYRYPVGAFSYYNRQVLEKVGLMDEFYKNFHEHVDHTLKISRAGYHPPYGWFADLVDSEQHLIDLDPELTQSMHRSPHWWFFLRNYGYFIYYTLKNGIRREGTEEEFVAAIEDAKIHQKVESVESQNLSNYG